MSGGSAIGGLSSWLLERVDESDEVLACSAPFVMTITVSPIERVSGAVSSRDTRRCLIRFDLFWFFFSWVGWEGENLSLQSLLFSFCFWCEDDEANEQTIAISRTRRMFLKNSFRLTI